MSNVAPTKDHPSNQVIASNDNSNPTSSSKGTKLYCKFWFDPHIRDKDPKFKIADSTKVKIAAYNQYYRQYYAELIAYRRQRALRYEFGTNSQFFFRMWCIMWRCGRYSPRIHFFIHHCCCWIRYERIENELKGSNLSEAEKQKRRAENASNESNYLRLRRSRMSIKDFTLLALLGKGGYGEVYLARKMDTGEIVALKRMKKSRFTNINQVRSERTTIKYHFMSNPLFDMNMSQKE
jgi:hypothetical protein